jgi:putative transposase
MGRIARCVIPGLWHHVTQRGNLQQAVFFDDRCRRVYLELLRRHCHLNQVGITGYCLMGNHVHVLAVPDRPDGLARAFGRAHNDYARWLNLGRRETGHLWQNRFYSCVLDELHRWEALRYVELNPVRAGLVHRPEHWPWSSARAHLRGDETGLVDIREWRQRWSPLAWNEALDHGIGEASLLERIRQATRTGRPAGGEDFVRQLETISGRVLRPQRRGPKRHQCAAEAQPNFEVM